MAQRSSNLNRWITGIIMAAILLAIIFLGPVWLLVCVIMLFCVGAIWEYNNLVFDQGYFKEKVEGLAFAFLIPLVFMLGDVQLLVAVIVFSLMITFILFLWGGEHSDFNVLSVAKITLGIIYIPVLTSHFVWLRQFDQGIFWVLFVLVIAVVGDTAALYTGKALGKRKLLPAVSPAKTVEGVLGLLAGSTIASLAFGIFLFPEIFWVHFLILGLIGGCIGQLGDLCESAIKRTYGKKDAGTLLPGHGGLLDRMDSLIFIAPYVYYYKLYWIG